MRRTFARRALAISVGLVATSVLLSGCLYASIPEGSEQPALPTDFEVPTDLAGFYEQDLAWEECDFEFECAVAAAPLDYADMSVGYVELALIRHRATGSDPIGSLVTNPGGPGASGVTFLRDGLSYTFSEELIDLFDIVSFDPRGVGSSTPVQCYDAEATDEYLFSLVDAPRGTPEWEAEITAEQRAWAEACDANSGGILPYISTVNAARDLDLIRALLGDEKLNYIGYSYGTFLGATYAELFPENVGRMLLDGAMDPSLPLTDVAAQQVIGFENALREYMAYCLSGRDCPFRGTVDQALSDVSALLASLDREPIPAADGRLLGADSMYTAIILPLYSEANWPILTTVFSQVLQGSPETAFYLADLYYDRRDGVYLSNQTEAFTAYNCVDFPVEVLSAEGEAELEALFAEQAPTFGPYSLGPSSCEVWPVPATGERAPITAAGAPPILVLGTTGDSATPYPWAVALADQLESGVLLTRVGEGHTGYFKGDACVDDAVEAYLLHGTLPAPGACG